LENLIELATEVELSGIEEKEKHLIECFERDAIVTDYEKGYISVPFVNQLINLELQGYAADIIVHNIETNKIEIDKVVQIPYSGNSLATSVGARLRVPLVLGRKEEDAPKGWKKLFPIRKKIYSFTTEKMMTFTFNELEKGDRVYIIDDVVASGDTASRIIMEFEERGIQVMGMGVYFAKLFDPGLRNIKEKTEIETFYVIGVEDITPKKKILFSKPRFKKSH